MRTQTHTGPHTLLLAALAALALAALADTARAQDTVTGAFEGVVRDSMTSAGIRGAAVEIINEANDLVIPTTTDARGYFHSAVLDPGTYTLRVSHPSYQSVDKLYELVIARPTWVSPPPIKLSKLSARARPPQRVPRAAAGSRYADTLVIFMVPASLRTPRAATTPATQQTPGATPKAAAVSTEQTVFRGSLLRSDARHDGSFGKHEAQSVPLGGTTLTRTFDGLAHLLPGVAPPPETIGGGAGPGVGAGVGSAGQFAVNGLRSRANNFTVDGSDDNDEDIGVRRQGFFALVPQPIESIQEYQVITLLAPAQFGRNLGAQVNAVSRSGGNVFHGTLYGLINSSRLNARDFFDTAQGSAATPLLSGTQRVLVAPEIDFARDFNPFTLNFEPPGLSPVFVRNGSGGKDSLTLGQGGFVLGGPVVERRLFFFVSAERQILNATREQSFAVPTVAQRGAFGTGATGIVTDPLTGDPTFAFPTTGSGDAVFSLFPFPNNPSGVYGAHTFTAQFPASARGLILSGKLDGNFRTGARLHTLAGRYNFTDDWRYIPSTGGALSSTLKARVRTQNFTFFVNSRLSPPRASTSLFNQLRLSYGRTRLRFDEVRDRAFLLPSGTLPGEPFLLNAPLLSNFTLPNFDTAADVLIPNTGPVLYQRAGTVEDILGPVGQVIIAGFSPVGVDVFNFPQRRVNNTYQLADQLTLHKGAHNFTFGTDNRRTELNSILPRNFRPLITYNGAPRLVSDGNVLSISNDFVEPVTLAAASAASGFAQTLTTGSDSGINLRFYQLNFFAQDEWRARHNLSFSYGLRYEHNTPPREVNRRIENTFGPAVALVPGLSQFIDGRDRIFDPDLDNFSPRLGLAYSPELFGRQGATVLRAGYGRYNDQILGAVVSQSRSVFPTYVTINTAGGLAQLFNAAGNDLNNLTQGFSFAPLPLALLNPTDPGLQLIQGGTLNSLNPAVGLNNALYVINLLASGSGAFTGASPIEITLPSRRLKTPGAHHYSLSLEQRLTRDTVVSIAYVGTRGHNLLRFTTPNLGPNAVPLVSGFEADVSPGPLQFIPQFFGIVAPPGTRITSDTFHGGRPVGGVGGINIFETTARSRYDAAQFEVRGRYRDSLQYRLSYTFGRAFDDVSDVFDLAGAPALPQDSLTFAGEYAPSSYDVRKLLAFNAVYDLPRFEGRAVRLLFGGLQLASTGHFRTGQPFTVNSIYDVNLDGNLTDRLDTTSGLQVTSDRGRPLILTTADFASLRASVGEDGRVARNTFRAGNVFELNLALARFFVFSEGRSFVVRAEVYNLTNRANFGVPVRFLEAPAFGRATSTNTPARRLQFYLRYSF
jgi:Carboxypeptidase regulatory-like domain